MTSIDTGHGSASVTDILLLKLHNAGLRRNGQDLLTDVCLGFDDRRLTVILGPNGAGKTLLLKLCHGLIAPTSGTVTWAHPELLTAPRGQSMVFQRPVILRRSVAANIEYALRVCGVNRAARPQRLQTALELAGLSGLATRSARVLSGGEQQRLALARAWAIQPQVLFLDEPTSHLDPGATRSIERMILSIRESGTKMIMTTHDLGQARRLADEIVFLNHGRVAEHSDATTFFQQPETPEARAFVEGRLLW
ncbi:MAG: ATP-binding cassette domain-containing protein [Gammaproteobacteria bacterium]|nr:ATP-binding cassette domain-containing protein [Gammaproteobacteria bacterium]